MLLDKIAYAFKLGGDPCKDVRAVQVAVSNVSYTACLPHWQCRCAPSLHKCGIRDMEKQNSVRE